MSAARYPERGSWVVASEGFGPDDVVGVLAAFGWLHRWLWWRRRGMVALSLGERRWQWVTPNGRAAHAAAAELARLVSTGAWVPGASPPPSLRGAEPYSG